jgi:NAD(P)-dependent dehydrogenase (short-subunit alcohol dehydrogenase family)
MRMQVAGKVVVVTGASGGIGLATARLLGARGAKVVLAARNEQALRVAAVEIPGSLAVRADLRSAEDIRVLVEQAVAAFGRIDCLVNNAGQDFNAPVEAIDPDDFRSILELNLIGALAAMQAVIPIMHRQGAGTIVNVSSGTTKMILTGSAGYSSSKAALNHLSLVAREELAPDGIVVSLIYPYITATDLERNAIGADEGSMAGPPPGIPPADPPEKVAQAILELIESGEAELSLVPRRG